MMNMVARGRRRTIQRLVITVWFAGLLSGCLESDAVRHGFSYSDGGKDGSPSQQVGEMLAYVRYVDGLRTLDSKPDAAMKSEVQTLERVVRENRRPLNRIKLAWLLAVPGTRFQDSKRSLGLLADVAEELGPGPGPLHDLVSWMTATIAQRYKLAQQLYKTRSRLRAERTRAGELDQRNQSLQEQTTDLRRKIHALTNLETGIDDARYP